MEQVKMGESRVCSLAFADSVMVQAEKEKEIKRMIRKLMRYFKKRN